MTRLFPPPAPSRRHAVDFGGSLKSLITELTAAGFDPSARCCVLAEGLLPYLSQVGGGQFDVSASAWFLLSSPPWPPPPPPNTRCRTRRSRCSPTWPRCARPAAACSSTSSTQVGAFGGGNLSACCCSPPCSRCVSLHHRSAPPCLPVADALDSLLAGAGAGAWGAAGDSATLPGLASLAAAAANKGCPLQSGLKPSFSGEGIAS